MDKTSLVIIQTTQFVNEPLGGDIAAERLVHEVIVNIVL